jgi:hypothetical protein
MKIKIDIEDYLKLASYVPENGKVVKQFDRIQIGTRYFDVTSDHSADLNIAMAYKALRENLASSGLMSTPFAILTVRDNFNNDTMSNEYTLTGMFIREMESGEETILYLLSPHFILSKEGYDFDHIADVLTIDYLKYSSYVKKVDLSNNPMTAMQLRHELKSANPELDDATINSCVQVFDAKNTRGNPVEIWFIQRYVLVLADTEKFLKSLWIRYTYEPTTVETPE